MSARYVVAPAAEQDIIEIASYVEAANPSAAATLATDIFNAIRSLSERPDLGHTRRDLTSLPVRFWSVRRRYLIIYRGDSEPIEVVRVLNSYRDVATILNSSD